ncbi:MAG: hypothetical protein WAL32_11045 [Terriglobales bacterium]
MSTNKREHIAILELSAGCLQEAVERLQQLCGQLHDRHHEAECTETAKYISSQVMIIREEATLLRNEL